MNWKDAITAIPAKGYTDRGNKYEAFVSDHSKYINLGTYCTSGEAKEAVLDYRINRFKTNVEKHGLNADDGVVYHNKYIAFRNGMIFNLGGNIMHGSINKSGYYHGLIDGIDRDYHKVIAECFLDNPENFRDVNHKNGNKLDLNVDNLEYTTHSDNVIHAYRTGLTKPQIGEAHHNSKITEDDVRYIRTSDKSSSKLSAELGIDSSTIRDIRRRKTWRHVK